MSDRTGGLGVAPRDLDEGSSTRGRRRLGALVYWFKKSRESWKQKYMDLKVELHRTKVRVADVLRSRDRWRARAEISEAKVAEMHVELERLRTYLSEPAEEPIKTQAAIV